MDIVRVSEKNYKITNFPEAVGCEPKTPFPLKKFKMASCCVSLILWMLKCSKTHFVTERKKQCYLPCWILTNHIDLTFNLRQHYINPRTRSGIVATPCTKIRLNVLSQYKVFWLNFIGILIRFGFRYFYNKIFLLTAYSIVFINRRFMWICYRHETTCAPFAGTFSKSLTTSCFRLAMRSPESLRHAILFHWFRLPDPLEYSLFHIGEYCQLLYRS